MRRRTTHDVLEGVADNVKSSRLGRFFSPFFRPRARAAPHGSSNGTTCKGFNHQRPSNGFHILGTCYLAWRHENLSIAALAMVLRVGFTIWSVVLDFQSVSTFELTCRNSICNVTGECTQLLTDGRARQRFRRAASRSARQWPLPSVLGNRSIKDIPSHSGPHASRDDILSRDGAGSHNDPPGVRDIRYRMRLVRMGAFFHFRRSQVWVRVAFGFALVPPFVLALTFPLQSGINTELFLERTCHDMTSLISSPWRDAECDPMGAQPEPAVEGCVLRPPQRSMCPLGLDPRALRCCACDAAHSTAAHRTATRHVGHVTLPRIVLLQSVPPPAPPPPPPPTPALSSAGGGPSLSKP